MEHTEQQEPTTIPDDPTPVEEAKPADQPGRIPVRRRSLRRFLKGAATLVTILVCLVVGTTVGYLHRTSDLFRLWMHETRKHPKAIIQYAKDPLAAFSPELQLPVASQHRLNLLLVGADSDYEDGRPVVLKNTHGRSDALMVVQVDFDQNRMTVLSIPRDTAVIIPNYDGKIHKINAAHSYGGPKLTQQTVESVFGIHTDYYLSLNFDAFQKVVNAIDGVDITVPKKLDYDDNWGHLHIHLKPGFQHLDGYKAMGYVRIRHPDDDVHRSQRQHEFMEAMRAKIMQPDTFMKLPDALNQITQNVDSDLLSAQQLTIANFARNVPKQNFIVATLPATEGPNFTYANVPESEKLIGRLFFAGKPNAVKVNVPDRTQTASSHLLVARASAAPRRRRHRRKRAVSTPAKETIGSRGPIPTGLRSVKCI